jgi:hypothetical protein
VHPGRCENIGGDFCGRPRGFRYCEFRGGVEGVEATRVAPGRRIKIRNCIGQPISQRIQLRETCVSSFRWFLNSRQPTSLPWTLVNMSYRDYDQKQTGHAKAQAPSAGVRERTRSCVEAIPKVSRRREATKRGLSKTKIIDGKKEHTKRLNSCNILQCTMVPIQFQNTKKITGREVKATGRFYLTQSDH